MAESSAEAEQIALSWNGSSDTSGLNDLSSCIIREAHNVMSKHATNDGNDSASIIKLTKMLTSLMTEKIKNAAKRRQRSIRPPIEAFEIDVSADGTSRRPSGYSTSTSSRRGSVAVALGVTSDTEIVRSRKESIRTHTVPFYNLTSKSIHDQTEMEKDMIAATDRALRTALGGMQLPPTYLDISDDDLSMDNLSMMNLR